MLEKTVLERLRKIISTWEALKAQIDQRGITEDLVLNDVYVQWAVTTPLYNIGEHAYEAAKELKDQYPQIPWILIAGVRQRLVHDYEGINWSIIAEVIFQDLPVFVESIRPIVQSLEEKEE